MQCCRGALSKRKATTDGRLRGNRACAQPGVALHGRRGEVFVSEPVVNGLEV